MTSTTGGGMNATQLQYQLKVLGACKEAVEWTKGKSLKKAWDTCERADWMLWLCGRMQGVKGWPTRQQIVLVSCKFAEDALPQYEARYPNDTCVRNCINVTRAWANGRATIEDVRKARAAAAAAYAAAAYAAADDRIAKLKEYADIVRQELKILLEDK